MRRPKRNYTPAVTSIPSTQMLVSNIILHIIHTDKGISKEYRSPLKKLLMAKAGTISAVKLSNIGL